MLAFVEALVDADTALCKNKGVAFFGWLYHSLGGASLKLVTPPRFGNPAMESLLKEATTACQRFNKAAPSDRKDMRSTASPRRRLGSGPLCSRASWTSLVRGVCSNP